MRTAQGLLWEPGTDWPKQHRTCWCCRSLKRSSETVGVFRNVDGSGASLTGLNRCGEVWTCPVCSAKVAETRRKELSAAMVAHLGSGGAAYLLTLTFPHEADHELSDLMKKFGKARQSFQNRAPWKNAMKDAGRIGSVSSLELTCSAEHGWHPHLHVLIFADAHGLGDGEPINVHGDLHSETIAQLQKSWVNVLLKCKLGDASKITDMMQHALNVRGGNQAAEYIAKYGRDERWGASSEMTAVHAKLGSAGERHGLMHFTPFQLLAWAGNGDAWAVAKFAEYAKAIKGKRALTWTPGLKKALLGTDEERSDEEIAADDDQPPTQESIGELQRDQYQDILRRNRLPDFIRYVAESAYMQSDLDDYVDAIRAIPRSHGGAVIVPTSFGGRKSESNPYGSRRMVS